MTRAQRSSAPDLGQCVGPPDGARDARITRSAWLLASLAVLFYVGYVAWNLWRGAVGS